MYSCAKLSLKRKEAGQSIGKVWIFCSSAIESLVFSSSSILEKSSGKLLMSIFMVSASDFGVDGDSSSESSTIGWLEEPGGTTGVLKSL